MSECSICCNADGRDMETGIVTILKSLPCGHQICKDCLKHYFDEQNKFQCPFPGCETRLDPGLYFKDYVPPLFEIKCKLCNSKHLLITPKNVICHNCKRIYLNKIPNEEIAKNNLEMARDVDSTMIRPCPICKCQVLRDEACNHKHCKGLDGKTEHYFYWGLDRNYVIGEIMKEPKLDKDRNIIPNEFDVFLVKADHNLVRITENGDEGRGIVLTAFDPLVHRAAAEHHGERQEENEFVMTKKFDKIKGKAKAEDDSCSISEPIPQKNKCKKCGKPTGLLVKDGLCLKCKGKN